MSAGPSPRRIEEACLSCFRSRIITIIRTASGQVKNHYLLVRHGKLRIQNFLKDWKMYIHTYIHIYNWALLDPLLPCMMFIILQEAVLTFPASVTSKPPVKNTEQHLTITGTLHICPHSSTSPHWPRAKWPDMVLTCHMSARSEQFALTAMMNMCDSPA